MKSQQTDQKLEKTQPKSPGKHAKLRTKKEGRDPSQLKPFALKTMPTQRRIASGQVVEPFDGENS
jgi:hypothetical protein